MKNLVLSVYGESFMSILNFDNLFNEIKKDVGLSNDLIIDLGGVNNISPSFMTRFINRLYDDLQLRSINIENANSRLETTFKFAQYSIMIKKKNTI